MDYFIRADQLKKKYTVYGSFYNLLLSSKEYLPCRNRLEIFAGLWTSRPTNIQPDALFIMMNPGSSAPLEMNIKPPDYPIDEVKNANEVPLNWVSAKPDITQYQVMRVMTAKGWKFVRVLNLSDIREPKSPAFNAILKQMSAKEPFDLHSIFSKYRFIERKNAFKLKKGAPIVLAWGKDKFLIDLAKKGFDSGNLGSAQGIVCDEKGLLYSHASPTLQVHKEQWLERILKII